jgi:DNA repair protein RadD
VAKIELREYQLRALSMLYDWLEKNTGHPCVVLPTGSGKSIVIAELCRRAITEWPETHIVMLTRSVELINQNAEKLRSIWPGAPMGIYSASAGKKQLGEPITIGGPLSIVRVTKRIGHCDLLLVDEAHDISHKDEGSYRKIINELMAINPSMRVIGFTASPFRLGHGMITDKPAIFDALIEPVSIEELIFKGYLATLRSKQTSFKLDTSSVHKRGGDFIESELQAAVDTSDNNEAMIDEVIKRSDGRKSWMFFATGVEHAQHLRDILLSRGISAVSVIGDMAKKDREQSIADFKSGKITAITQVGCLNVGFDHPAIDLLVMARPTMSPGLYLQQAGRGMRPHAGKADCLVLDFAGVVEMHGPITNVQPPKKSAGDGEGEAPVKVCDACGELVHISAMTCPACGAAFPEPVKKAMVLRNDDIMGLEGKELEVTAWAWREHTSKASGKQLLAVTYYGGLSDAPITEYLPILHEGYAGQRAMSQLVSMANSASIVAGGLNVQTMIEMVQNLNNATPPKLIEYRKDGKFFRVLKRSWE